MNGFTEFYPYGTQYHRAPTPLPEEWDTDMAEIKNKGYTHVQFRPQWRWHERIRGEYTWDDLDGLFETAKKYGLRVVLKPMLETAPDWVFTELDGARRGFHGKTLDPIAHAAFYVGGWLPCFDNPEVAHAAQEFVTALVNRYKDHPSLWFYNAWNEPRSRPMAQCTCKHSTQSYRDFLRREYCTIENLNNALGKAWTSFDTIFPSHSPSDFVELFLWRRWAGSAVAEHVGLVSEAIRKADPNARIMCHVGSPTAQQDPAYDTSNDMLNREKVDWYGTSMWISLQPEDPVEYNMTFYQSAWVRRVDPEYWCHEFYTNQGLWSRRADPAFVEQSALMSIASGCKGFTYWQYRSERFGEESDGYGMRNVDGSETPRSIRCDRIGKFLSEIDSSFTRSAPRKSQVALYFDDKNDLLLRIQAMSCGLTDIETVGGTWDYAYKAAMHGAHTYLRRLGHTADFVINGDDLSDYKAVVVSCLEMTDGNVAKNLTYYVKNGGTLYIEYPFACRDNNTWVSPVRPNSGLEALTGCREVERQIFSSDAQNVIYFDSYSEQTDGWHINLEPVSDDVKILGRWEDGSAAVVERRVGKGRVVVSAGNFSMIAPKDPNGKIPSIFRTVLEIAGIYINESSLWDYSRFSDEYEYRFYFNTEKKDETVGIIGELIYASEECTVNDSGVTIPLHCSAVFKIKL